MLKSIQIVALLQGLFLMFTLLKRSREYQKVNFWLLLGCILSVVLFAIGDDDYNLFVRESNWYLFHETLIITFFFLFVRYYQSGRAQFRKRDYLFFIPYLLHTLENYKFVEQYSWIKKSLGIIELVFIAMLLFTIYDILKSKKEKWLLVFIVPFAIVFTIDEFAYFLTSSDNSPFFLDSYGIILVTIIMLYAVLYKLIAAPKDVLPKSDGSKYKNSRLDTKSIETHKIELLRLMTEEKLFRNSKLSVDDVAKLLGIPRQHLSEVLNVHMKVGFQDLLNEYRVEDFIECLRGGTYHNYTLLGIANEVGFSSKTSFNSAFKKLKGMTPSEYKKTMVNSTSTF